MYFKIFIFIYSTAEVKMTMAATLINGLKYRFHTLHESGKTDILDGNEFFVQYIGCTCITEDYDMACDKQIDDFFNFVVSECQQLLNAERLLFKLIVHRNGAMICDTNGNMQYSFKACDISYVTATNSRRYSKYLIVVARTGQEQTLKGHVLLCRNKANAKLACQTFTEIFKMARATVTITTANQEVLANQGKASSEDKTDCSVATRKTCGCNRIAGHALCSVNNHNLQNDLEAVEILEESLDDGFTELARSRSADSCQSAGSSKLTFRTFFSERHPRYENSVFY